jgi:hypothetical protein
MAKIIAGLAIAGLAAGAQAQTINFDNDPTGTAPAGWVCGSTGGGLPRWVVEADPGAASPPNVLKQSGSGPFPWCVKQGTSLADGAVEVKFKPLSGREDQAGGVVWRWKDGDNYYVARANALENNVNLYHVTGGIRRQIAGVDVAVPTGQTQQLGVRIEGNTIKTSLDVKLLFEAVDRTIAGPGAVEIWTKADSVTAVYELAITVIRE